LGSLVASDNTRSLEEEIVTAEAVAWVCIAVYLPLMTLSLDCLKHSATSSIIDNIKFQSHLFCARWQGLVDRIRKKPSVVEELRKLVVTELSCLDDSDDTDNLGQPATDCEGDKGGEGDEGDGEIY
jgi:hypothetical protein